MLKAKYERKLYQKLQHQFEERIQLLESRKRQFEIRKSGRKYERGKFRKYHDFNKRSRSGNMNEGYFSQNFFDNSPRSVNFDHLKKLNDIIEDKREQIRQI